MWKVAVVFLSLLIQPPAWGQIDVTDTPEVGPERAREYMRRRTPSPATTRRPASRPLGPTGSRYLSLHVGGFLDEDVYRWGSSENKDVGKLNAGVTYKIGEWTQAMDLLFRADFTSFELLERRAVKMSLLPLVVFPDSASGFPLYFGAGIGPGVFLRQVPGSSSLSLDYQILAGARFYEVVKGMGLMFEAGLKNHVHIFSKGQHNGVFFTSGMVFRF